MRRMFKVLLWIVLGPLVLLLLLLCAWVASNGRWADVAPQPVPPELMPQAVTLAPEANAFFDAQGLRAPEGDSPNAWGQRVWRGEAVDAAQLLPLPAGEDWTCHATKTDCVARWRASAQALAAQMAAAKVFGERCRALAGKPGYQEPVPVRKAQPAGAESIVPYAMPQFLPASTCMRWLQIEAVLAPDAQRARASWELADALLRHVAAGTQTLIGHAIAWNWVARHQVLLAQWAAGQPPGDGALPTAWLEPLPSRILQPRFWMAAESHFQRETATDLADRSEQMFGMEPNALQAWVGRQSLGYLPELTRQSMDGYWLAQVRLHGSLQGLALAQSVRKEPEPGLTPWWGLPSWRNTVGSILIEVARPAFAGYPRQQADLVLYHSALGLSQQLNAVPVVQRAAWWDRLPLEAGLRERLSLAGDALLIRTWQGEVESPQPAPVRFPLRPS